MNFLKHSFLLAACLTFCPIASAQITAFPYQESFDAASPPTLPASWMSSQQRTPGVNDFTTTSSSPHSLPNAVLSTNATIAQEITSPVFEFIDDIPDSISFFTRRSSTHLAPVVLELSFNGGLTFDLQVGDTLLNTVSSVYIRHAFPLPAIPDTAASAVFRWRISPASSGTTGTFRIDDVLITTKVLDDLALVTTATLPPYPIAADSIDILSAVLNEGLRKSTGFSLEAYLDDNLDSTAQLTELITLAQSDIALAPGESTTITLSINPLPAGSHLIILQLQYLPDRKPENNIRFQNLFIGVPRSSVVVNEIMYAPSGSEPEWIELYNASADSINLQSWIVSDVDTSSGVMITGESFLLTPAGFVLITDDSAALRDIHPEIQDRIFNAPSLPVFNNSGDLVLIVDQRGAVMDSLPYSPDWGGDVGGTSLERIDPAGPALLASNWGTSRSPTGSTPGATNSLAQKDHDLQLRSLTLNPPVLVSDDSAWVIGQIVNLGKNEASTFVFSLYHDLDADSSAEPEERLLSVPSTGKLAPGDSIDLPVTIVTPEAVSGLLISVLYYLPDNDTTNNVGFLPFLVGQPAGSVLINEIMYAPPSGMPEWIEIYNASNDTVDIREWMTGNRLAGNRYVISHDKQYLSPDQLVVITKDTALLHSAYPALSVESVIQVEELPTFLWNNTGDAVVFVDHTGSIVDSLFYSTDWGGGNGASLERIDSELQSTDSSNWATSVDPTGGTPAKANSVVRLPNDLMIVRIVSVSGGPADQIAIPILVRNNGRLESGPFSLILYADSDVDSVGSSDEEVATAFHNLPLSAQESLVVSLTWRQPPSGIHTLIASLEYEPDMRPSDNVAFGTVSIGFPLGTLVINEIMYAPLSGTAEYVEFYNAGDASIDLSGWAISDTPREDGTPNSYDLSMTRRLLNDGEFFLLASDSSLLAPFPNLGSAEQRLVNMTAGGLSLNNEGDGIILRDASGRAIDSLMYEPSWHHPGVIDRTGRSLEKVNPLLPGFDKRNWSTCTRTNGGTPGEQNSLYVADLPTNARLSFSPNPFSPDGNGHEDFTIVHYQLPSKVSTISITIYDVRGRLIRRLATNEPAGANGSVVWDGRDGDNQKARIGMYVVYIEAISSAGGAIQTAKAVVVLAARL